MPIDLLIAVSALVIALLGTLSRDLNLKWKKVLVTAACIAFLAAIAKSVSDDREKQFLKDAITLTLVPTNPQFTRIQDEFDHERDLRGMNAGSCHHQDFGDICFYYSTTDPWKNATVVFNKEEVAKIYANQLDKKNSEDLIKDRFDHLYQPIGEDDWDEEFVDRVGLLGMGICFSKNDSWEGAGYNYDPKFGIRLVCGTFPNGVEAQLTKDDLRQFHNGPSWDVFNRLDSRIRSDFDVKPEKELQSNVAH